jgi:hypothetical protein
MITPRRRAGRRALAAARALAATRLAEQEVALDKAVTAYATARDGRAGVAALRATHLAAAEAYRAAIVAAQNAEGVAPGTVSARVGRLRTALQVHVLEATSASGIRVPTSVRVSSRAATGPRIAGMGFGFEDPYGPAATRTIGVNLSATSELPVDPPTETPIRPPAQRPAPAAVTPTPTPAAA